MTFLMVNNFFLCGFKNNDQKNICVSTVFKAKSEVKHEERKFLGCFSSKTKNALFTVIQNISIFKTQISLMSKKASFQFSPQNVNICAPWNF